MNRLPLTVKLQSASGIQWNGLEGTAEWCELKDATGKTLLWAGEEHTDLLEEFCERINANPEKAPSMLWVIDMLREATMVQLEGPFSDDIQALINLIK